MKAHSTEIDIRWSDLDPNRHLGNVSFLEFFVHVRFTLFASGNFPHDYFEKNQIGPVVLHEELVYLKEAHADEKVTVEIMIGGISEDKRFWRYYQTMYNEAGEKLAVCIPTFCWINLETRKIVLPPAELMEFLENQPRPSNFKVLTKADTLRTDLVSDTDH